MAQMRVSRIDVSRIRIAYRRIAYRSVSRIGVSSAYRVSSVSRIETYRAYHYCDYWGSVIFLSSFFGMWEAWETVEKYMPNTKNTCVRSLDTHPKYTKYHFGTSGAKGTALHPRGPKIIPGCACAGMGIGPPWAHFRPGALPIHPLIGTHRGIAIHP